MEVPGTCCFRRKGFDGIYRGRSGSNYATWKHIADSQLEYIKGNLRHSSVSIWTKKCCWTTVTSKYDGNGDMKKHHCSLTQSVCMSKKHFSSAIVIFGSGQLIDRAYFVVSSKIWANTSSMKKSSNSSVGEWLIYQNLCFACKF